MIRDALYLVVAVIVLALVGDWLIRRAAKDVKDAVPKVPTLGEIVAAPGTIKRGFWDFVKETVSGVPNDESYIDRAAARKLADSELAKRRMRLSGFGAGLSGAR